MNAAAKELPKGEGDWLLRGMDPETRIYARITPELIDADAYVRNEWGYGGFPCWALYRCAIAQDYVLLAGLRQWVIGFAVVYAECGGLRVDARSDEMIGGAALDALYCALNGRHFMLPGKVAAEALGVRRDTYVKFRNALAGRLLASLDLYVCRLLLAIREVGRVNKRTNPETR